MKRILIIEDDTDLREGLSFSLQLEGYETLESGTVKESQQLLDSGRYDLILLDCNLPDGSGFDFCTWIKKEHAIPVLMLTARDTEMDEVKALELGVDDFMSKPFSLAVLKARMKKLLSRDAAQKQLTSNGIMVDRDTGKVYKHGEEIICSRIEYQMLVYFMENADRVLSRDQILSHVWDRQGRFVEENTVPVNIRRLRAKIEEDPGQPKRIKTVHGMGYIWKDA